MPQMMPMLWTIMFIFTMKILLITSIYIYFLNLPLIFSLNSYQKIYKFSKWNWLW